MKLDRLAKIPVHEWNGLQYVDLNEIPEPVRSAFHRTLYGAQVPAVPGVGVAAYVWDWELFLERYRRAN